MKIRPDYSLYLCTDRILSLGRPIAEALEQALVGGVTVVQIREKDASTREFYRLALEIQEVTRRYNVPLIVNDRVDIALAVGAQGLHLGQSDMPLAVARRLTGDGMIIGVSVSTVEEARTAQAEGADYLGAGAVFPTGSKADVTDPIGLEGLREICAAAHVPVVAIGGINQANAAAVRGAGADGIAVISAILSQPDITAAAKSLKACL